MERIASQERIAGMNAGIKASAQKQVNDQNLDISNAKIHLESMRTGADLLKGR
jgi:hypothetical protein